MKNKYVAWLIAIMFWCIWLHKFYLGKWVQWIIYLIFCLTWIPMVIWFFEWIIYIINTNEWFNLNYNMDYIKNKQLLNNIK